MSTFSSQDQKEGTKNKGKAEEDRAYKERERKRGKPLTSDAQHVASHSITSLFKTSSGKSTAISSAVTYIFLIHSQDAEAQLLSFIIQSSGPSFAFGRHTCCIRVKQDANEPGMQYISGLFFPAPVSFSDTLQPLL